MSRFITERLKLVIPLACIVIMVFLIIFAMLYKPIITPIQVQEEVPEEAPEEAIEKVPEPKRPETKEIPEVPVPEAEVPRIDDIIFTGDGNRGRKIGVREGSYVRLFVHSDPTPPYETAEEPALTRVALKQMGNDLLIYAENPTGTRAYGHVNIWNLDLGKWYTVVTTFDLDPNEEFWYRESIDHANEYIGPIMTGHRLQIRPVEWRRDMDDKHLESVDSSVLIYGRPETARPRSIGTWVIVTRYPNSLDEVFASLKDDLGCDWVYVTFVFEWGDPHPLDLAKKHFQSVFWVGKIEQFDGTEGNCPWAKDYYFDGLVKTLDEPRTMFGYSVDQVVDWVNRFKERGQEVGIEFDGSFDEDSPLPLTISPKVERSYAEEILKRCHPDWIGIHYYPFKDGWEDRYEEYVEAFGPVVREWRDLADKFNVKFFVSFPTFENLPEGWRFPPFENLRRMLDLTEGVSDVICFHDYGGLRNHPDHLNYVKALTSAGVPAVPLSSETTGTLSVTLYKEQNEIVDVLEVKVDMGRESWICLGSFNASEVTTYYIEEIHWNGKLICSFNEEDRPAVKVKTPTPRPRSKPIPIPTLKTITPTSTSSQAHAYPKDRLASRRKKYRHDVRF